MNVYISKTTTKLACAMLFFTVVAGCSVCNSSPPESLLQSSLSELVTNDAKGLVTLSNIKKMDGQLQSDGLSYLMDYEARFTTEKCTKSNNYGGRLTEMPFDALEEHSAKRAGPGGYTCTVFAGKLWNRMKGYVWGAGYSADVTGQVLFTKKEKGWGLVKAHMSLKGMPENGAGSGEKNDS